MDFSWTAEQKEIGAEIKRFAEQELNDDIVERDRNGDFYWDGWKKCAEFGIPGLPAPQEFGGSGMDALTTVCALESLGYGCRDNGLLFAINAHLWGSVVSLMTFGTPEQKERYLKKLATGEWVGGHAMTEPMSGSDSYGLSSRAERKGDRYVLNGRKTFITNAPIADMIIVFAKVEKPQEQAAITGFIVEKGTPGMAISPPLEKMGLRTSPMAEVVLTDCEVPVENVVLREGAGQTIFNASMEWERICILASHLGTLQRSLEASTKYAQERRQFGKPIGSFEAVSNKIAEMDVHLEAARLLVYKAAWLKSVGRHATREASIAKLYASEICIKSYLDAIQIHGGYGYMTEYPFERTLRDAVAGTIYSGTSEIQKLIIAGFRGL